MMLRRHVRRVAPKEHVLLRLRCRENLRRMNVVLEMFSSQVHLRAADLRNHKFQFVRANGASGALR